MEICVISFLGFTSGDSWGEMYIIFYRDFNALLYCLCGSNCINTCSMGKGSGVGFSLVVEVGSFHVIGLSLKYLESSSYFIEDNIRVWDNVKVDSILKAKFNSYAVLIC